MDHRAISQQLLIEHELLAHLESALRNVLRWTSHRHDLPRKLSSLRFMNQAYERHLERLMTLEEHGGYMEVVVESRPTLAPQVDGLRADHDRFRKSLRRVGALIDRLSPDEPDSVAQVSEELSSVLDEVNAHSKKEIDLLQESLLQEDGGHD